MVTNTISYFEHRSLQPCPQIDFQHHLSTSLYNGKFSMLGRTITRFVYFYFVVVVLFYLIFSIHKQPKARSTIDALLVNTQCRMYHQVCPLSSSPPLPLPLPLSSSPPPSSLILLSPPSSLILLSPSLLPYPPLPLPPPLSSSPPPSSLILLSPSLLPYPPLPLPPPLSSSPPPSSLILLSPSLLPYPPLPLPPPLSSSPPPSSLILLSPSLLPLYSDIHFSCTMRVPRMTWWPIGSPGASSSFAS